MGSDGGSDGGQVNERRGRPLTAQEADHVHEKMCRKPFFMSQITLDIGRSSYDVMSVLHSRCVSYIP